jgi:hypothetical protein
MIIASLLYLAGAAFATQVQELPSCQVYSENQCQGNAIVTDPSFEDHRWFTPKKGQAGYISSFQDFSVLAAHVHMVYDSSRTSGKIAFIAPKSTELDCVICIHV